MRSLFAIHAAIGEVGVAQGDHHMTLTAMLIAVLGIGVVVLAWALRIRRRRNRGEPSVTDEQRDPEQGG